MVVGWAGIVAITTIFTSISDYFTSTTRRRMRWHVSEGGVERHYRMLVRVYRLVSANVK